MRKRLRFKGWRLHVIGPLDTTPVHQASANACRKEHRNPTDRAEFWLTVAQPNFAKPAHANIQNNRKGRGTGQNIEPAECLSDPRIGDFENSSTLFRKNKQRYRHAQQHDNRNGKINPIDLLRQKPNSLLF